MIVTVDCYKAQKVRYSLLQRKSSCSLKLRLRMAHKGQGAQGWDEGKLFL